jgi:hypothetical protein
MSSNWDYAEMAAIARKAGGPKAGLNLVKEQSFNEGAKVMQKKYVPYIGVAGVVGLAVGGAITITFLKVKDKIALIRKKRVMEVVVATEAEKLLIEELNTDQSSKDMILVNNQKDEEK